MKIAVKGGAAVDPESGNFINLCPFFKSRMRACAMNILWLSGGEWRI